MRQARPAPRSKLTRIDHGAYRRGGVGHFRQSIANTVQANAKAEPGPHIDLAFRDGAERKFHILLFFAASEVDLQPLHLRTRHINRFRFETESAHDNACPEADRTDDLVEQARHARTFVNKIWAFIIER